MPTVAPVRLTYNPRVLWFDPNDIEFEQGDALIVKTERGLEYGIAEENVKEVDEEAIAKLKSPLKPVIRKASSEDTCAWKEAQQAALDALPVFKQMVAERNLDMHPVAVEFLFDGDKAVFYFEAEERVDFRELVRALVSRFHRRIDMRQIGVRDEARIVGGFGHCGQELCCKRLGGEFKPVSIRMAKDQDLSLNPQKISGICGRLMCCLRYEDETYKEFKSCCPKVNAMVSTPQGDAKVSSINVPRETLTLVVDEKQVEVPVSAMDIDPKTGKPASVSQEVLDKCSNQGSFGRVAVESLVTSVFTGSDKLADRTAAHTSDSSSSRRPQQKAQGKAPADDTRKKSVRKRRSHSTHGTDIPSQDSSQDRTQRRSTSSSKKRSAKPFSPSQQKQQGKQGGAQQAKRQEARRGRAAVRPGQRSSSLASSPTRDIAASYKERSEQAQTAVEHRRSRRRSHRAQGGEQRKN